MTDIDSTKTHQQEIDDGDRFAFGKNWLLFLSTIDEERIQRAVDSLKQMLKVDSLDEKTFLDIGSGSGLSSLAAKRLGAKVVSIDYDPQSVACTKELKRRFFEGDGDWKIEMGSVLDRDYLKSLGQFDIVYSWGVLHHTGAMWSALENVNISVAPGGRLWIALYNDQGSKSKQWSLIKKIYNNIPKFLRPLFSIVVYIPYELNIFLNLLVRLKPQIYINNILQYKRSRGMSWWHDHVDWIGGYPFEVSKPEQIFDFYIKCGYSLLKLRTCGGRLGCNEFIFQRINATDRPT